MRPYRLGKMLIGDTNQIGHTVRLSQFRLIGYPNYASLTIPITPASLTLFRLVNWSSSHRGALSGDVRFDHVGKLGQ